MLRRIYGRVIQRLFHRGSMGFAVLMIINPVILVFYQNCAVLPSNSLLSDYNAQTSVSRGIASVGEVQSNSDPYASINQQYSLDVNQKDSSEFAQQASCSAKSFGACKKNE